MKSLFQRIARIATPIAAAALVSFSLPVATEAAALDFENLEPSKRGEFVRVDVPRSLIALAAKIVAQEQPAIADLLGGINGVHVRVISLDEGNRASVTERVATIRAGLSKEGWHHLVTAQKTDGEDVAIHMKSGDEDRIEGVAITVIDHDHEAVLVHVEGSIQPDQIADLAIALNVPQLADISGAFAGK